MSDVLTPRDREILRHVRCYRMSTREFLQRLFFPDATASAVGKVVVRLAERDWLRERKLDSGFSYLVLGRRASQAVPTDKSCFRPFTEQSLPAAYATLAFCVARNARRFDANEFRERFPELCRPRMHTGGFYVDVQATPCRLGSLLLDRANSPENILRKVRRLIRQRYRIPGFVPLIHQGLYSITIVTAWPLKKDYLDVAVRMALASQVPVETAVVPELQTFYRRA